MAWTCQRVARGVRCATLNPNRKRNCQKCGKPRPARRRPTHLVALELSYEDYVRLNELGERCGICGAKPTPGRRLDRDHDHRTGKPRGLLCHLCNRTLGNRDAEWLLRAVAYLQHAKRAVR